MGQPADQGWPTDRAVAANPSSLRVLQSRARGQEASSAPQALRERITSKGQENGTGIEPAKGETNLRLLQSSRDLCQHRRR